MKDDLIKSGKQLAEFATELTDEEVQKTVGIIRGMQMKYAGKSNTAGNLERMRDEVLTRLSEIGVLATFDPAPCFYGEPPIVDIVGKVAGDALHKDGFDHDLKRFEVQTSKERGEDYYGQKEPLNAKSKAAKRTKAHRENVRKLQDN